MEPQGSKHRRHLTYRCNENVRLDVATCESGLLAAVVPAEHGMFEKGRRSCSHGMEIKNKRERGNRKDKQGKANERKARNLK